METTPVHQEKPYFSGREVLGCETCHGSGRVFGKRHSTAFCSCCSQDSCTRVECTAQGCCGGYVECESCADGTTADVQLVCGDALCVGCLIRDGLPEGVKVARHTVMGGIWLSGWGR